MVLSIKKFSPIELSKTGKSVKKCRSGWEALDGVAVSEATTK